MSFVKAIDPSIWDTNDSLDEDMSVLRANRELASFSDLQLQEAWFSFCREIHLCSWVTPEGRDKHFVAYLILKQAQDGKDGSLDWEILGQKVEELWPTQ